MTEQDNNRIDLDEPLYHQDTDAGSGLHLDDGGSGIFTGTKKDNESPWYVCAPGEQLVLIERGKQHVLRSDVHTLADNAHEQASHLLHSTTILEK